jgi:hypothetical protein
MGMKKLSKMIHAEMVTAHYQSAEWMLNFGCGTQEEGTGITLMLSPGDGTVPEGEGTEVHVEGAEGGNSTTVNGATTDEYGNEVPMLISDDLPDGFPVDVIPLYPGAKINEALAFEGNAILELRSSDADHLLHKFYDKHFRELGWKLVVSTTTDEGYVANWTKGDAGVAMNLAKDGSGTLVSFIYTAS